MNWIEIVFFIEQLCLKFDFAAFSVDFMWNTCNFFMLKQEEKKQEALEKDISAF